MTTNDTDRVTAARRQAAQRHAGIEVVSCWDKLYTTLAMEFGADERFSRLSGAIRDLRRCL